MNIDLQPVEYDPFGGPEITKVIPAIEPQLEIWTACHIGGADASRAYIESVSMRMTGAFNRQAIERALKAVVNRHESLRSVFSTDGTDMLVYAEIDADIQYGDLSALVPQEQNEYIDNFIKENGLLPFDLVAGPLFRCSLFELSHSECYLTFSAHHIICDGWSLGIILQDLSRYYNAFISGGIPEIPAAPSFSSYADAQREFIGSIEYAHTEKYWLSQYEDSVPAVEMPLDFPRPVIRTYKSTRVDYALDVPTVLALKAIGIKAGCSFVTTLISAFEIFIQKLTKQHDIVLAIPAAGQSATGNTGLVGHCVNLLPFRSSYNGTTTFTGYLKDRKSRILDSYEYQQLTFGTLLKKLNIPRDPSRVPMVPVVFNIDMGLDNGVAFSGLEYKLNYNPRQYETFELFLNVSGSEKELVFEWSYNCRLFTELSIEAMMSDFKALLSFFIQQPDLKIADIPVFRQDEIKVNPTENNTVEYPKEKTIHELIQDSAELYPDNTAVFFNGQSFSYKNINQTANQLAVLLQINGVKPGEVVAIALERSPEMVMALLAVLKAGAVYLPLDPAYPKERVEYMLEDAKAKVLLTSKKFEGSFTTSATSLYMEDARIRLPRYSFENAVSPVKGNALAYIIYTSGSTGKPKGVQIEHSSVVNLLLSMQNKPGITAADRLLAITTIAFDIAGLELYLPLITGACVVLADTDAAKDGRLLAALVKSEGVTIMQATPSMWRIMLESGDYNALPAKILCGGEPMGVDLAARLLPRCQSLWNLYGPTETTIWSTVKQVVMDNDALLIGKPINNTRIYIYDELLQALPAGETGDIFIGGDGLSRGYVGKPDITTLVFTEHTLRDGTKEKIYKTGDTGKWTPQGDIKYIGRCDNQLKIRGFRIEPGEIENLLLGQEGISEAAVVAKDNRLLAFIVTKNELSVNGKVAGWKSNIKCFLPHYMIPDEFIAIQKMPLTPNGKTDRKALLAIQQTTESTNEYTAPRDEMETLIGDIWMELLGLKKISIYDDFFELGGHSMLAIQAMTRLEKKTGKRLPVASLFEATTIEKLAEWVGGEGKSVTMDCLLPLKASGRKPALYIVHGYDMNVFSFTTVAKHLDQDQPVFGLQPKSLNNIDLAPLTMEEVAAEYIAEIFERDPVGPYALAGYSFGGYIAFEIARQLKKMGKKVKMLAMFDAYAYSENTDHDDHSQKLKKKVMRQFPKAQFVFSSLLRQPKETLEYQSLFLKRKLKEIIGAKEKAEKAPTQEDAVYERYEYAYRHYKLVPFDGVIDLFRVTTRLYFLDDPKFLGWGPFAGQGIKIHDIPGDHKTFIQVPNNRDFARILQKALDEAV